MEREPARLRLTKVPAPWPRRAIGVGLGGLIGWVVGVGLDASAIPGIPIPSGEMSYSVLGLLIGSGIGYYVGKSPGTDTTKRGSKSGLSSRS